MTKNIFRIFVFILTTIIFLNESCVSKKKLAERYINNDSTAVFSTHQSRPFKYGYAYSKDECKSFRPKLDNYKIKNGDIIADIGAASGWLEGVFSTMVDSVTFFVQDIDTNILNKNQLNGVVQHFSSIRSTPQTNTFNLVIGSNKKTKLPDSLFNKIIINNTFHEFVNPFRIIQDLTTKLKPGGQIIVYDQMSNQFRKTKHEGCEIIADKATSVVDYFSLYDFYLTNMTEPENSFHNYLTFELNKQKSDSFKLKRNSVDSYLKKLDSLNLNEISADSTKTEKIALSLKPNIEKILEVYSSLESYLNALGYILLKDNKTKEAINVLRANVILFPESSDTYDSLGEAYLKNKNYTQSLDNYNISLKLNQDNDNAKDKIKEINQQLHK
jgi:protein-L-isoaspartate O-methyltransferase